MGAIIASLGPRIVKYPGREYEKVSERGFTDMTTIDNGVNVAALLDAREVLKGAPEAAQFKWRATNK